MSLRQFERQTTVAVWNTNESGTAEPWVDGLLEPDCEPWDSPVWDEMLENLPVSKAETEETIGKNKN